MKLTVYNPSSLPRRAVAFEVTLPTAVFGLEPLKVVDLRNGRTRGVAVPAYVFGDGYTRSVVHLQGGLSAQERASLGIQRGGDRFLVNSSTKLFTWTLAAGSQLFPQVGRPGTPFVIDLFTSGFDLPFPYSRFDNSHRLHNRAVDPSSGFQFDTRLQILEGTLGARCEVLMSSNAPRDGSRLSPESRTEPFTISFGAFPVLDQSMVGVSPPFRSGDRWHVVIPSMGWVDGSCFRFSCTLIPTPVAGTDIGEEELAEARAMIESPVMTSFASGAWDGNFGPGRFLPEIDLEEEVIEASKTRFITAKGPHSSRAFLIEHPHQAGSQADFGPCWFGVGPRSSSLLWPMLAQWEVDADHARGYHLDVPIGRMTPGWKCLNGYTHYSKSQSPNRIGRDWPDWTPRGATGWKGYDGQHISLNLHTEFAILNGPFGASSDFLLGVLRALANDVYRSEINGIGRASGRELMALANIHNVMGDHPLNRQSDGFERITLNEIEVRIVTIHEKLKSMPGEVRPLASNPADSRINVVDPSTGQLAPFWATWEQVILIHGLWLASLTLESAAENDHRAEVAKRLLDLRQKALACVSILVNTVLEHATFFDETYGWCIADDVRYAGGKPLGEDELALDSGSIVHQINGAYRGLSIWTLPAAALCLFRPSLFSSEALDRAKQICSTSKFQIALDTDLTLRRWIAPFAERAVSKLKLPIPELFPSSEPSAQPSPADGC